MYPPFKYHSAYICIHRITVSYYPVAYISTHTCPNYGISNNSFCEIGLRSLITYISPKWTKKLNASNFQLHASQEYGKYENFFDACALIISSSLQQMPVDAFGRRPTQMRFLSLQIYLAYFTEHASDVACT